MPEWPSGFTCFIQFQSEFHNKKFMIWVTVSLWSHFCWPYRASPSLAAKNIINLVLVLTIWLYSCAESSLVLLEESFCWSARSLGKALLSFVQLHFVPQGQTCLLLQVSLDFIPLHSSPLWWKGHLFFGVSSRKSSRNPIAGKYWRQ